VHKYRFATGDLAVADAAEISLATFIPTLHTQSPSFKAVGMSVQKTLATAPEAAVNVLVILVALVPGASKNAIFKQHIWVPSALAYLYLS
jgi:hypothetical protein